jgi:hypothetical protein
MQANRSPQPEAHRHESSASPGANGSQKELPFAEEVRHRIERMLRIRRAPEGTARRDIESRMKDAGASLWTAMKKRPSIGVVLWGGVGLMAAEVIGVAELAAGIAFAYAAYQVLRKGMPVADAIEKGLEVEQRATGH